MLEQFKTASKGAARGGELMSALMSILSGKPTSIRRRSTPVMRQLAGELGEPTGTLHLGGGLPDLAQLFMMDPVAALSFLERQAAAEKRKRTLGYDTGAGGKY
jgi:hypothetical protein